MEFTRNSGLVKVWVSLVRSETYTPDQVPDLYNLKEVVTEITGEEA